GSNASVTIASSPGKPARLRPSMPPRCAGPVQGGRRAGLALELIAAQVGAMYGADCGISRRRAPGRLTMRTIRPTALVVCCLFVGRQQAEGLALRKWVLVASSPDLTAVVTVQVPETESATYPDAAVRAALATLTVRANVPVEEQLGVLPFTLRDLAGFRIIRV